MAIRKVPSKGPGAKRKINPRAGKGSFGQDKIVAKVAKPIDDDITSESDHDMKDVGYDALEASQFEETAGEKKLRLTKQLLAERSALTENLEEELEKEVLEEQGRVEIKIADQLKKDTEISTPKFHLKHAHPLSITCSCVNKSTLYTACKKGFITSWCLETGKKINKINSKNGIILAMAVNDQFLATGGKNTGSENVNTGEGGNKGREIAIKNQQIGIVDVWDPTNLSHKHSFTGHKGAINGLAFRQSGNLGALYSASEDRTIKVWDCALESYVETLYGHQCGVQAIDAWQKERCVSVGGRDNTLCVFKIPEESHLSFQGHKGSIDCVKLLNDQTFITGGADDGAICLWYADKRKPKFTFPSAHGDTNWIISMASIVNADIFATGSNSGEVKIWKLHKEGKPARFASFKVIRTIKVAGFVNALSFSADGANLCVGVGKEHRLGRWWCDKSVKNSVFIYDILTNDGLTK